MRAHDVFRDSFEPVPAARLPALLRRLRSVADMPPRQCQWIEGDPTLDDTCKCLKPVMPGRPYCPEHCERAYLPAAVDVEVSASAEAK